jgi:hypothetical protein
MKFVEREEIPRLYGVAFSVAPKGVWPRPENTEYESVWARSKKEAHQFFEEKAKKRNQEFRVFSIDICI